MNQNMWRRMAAMLLAVLMMTAGLAAAEGTEAAVVADLTAEEAAEPVLLASVNGEEIWSNNEEMLNVISSLFSNGYEESDAHATALKYVIENLVYRQKAEELAVPEMTEEQRNSRVEEVKKEWDEIVNNYATDLSNLTDESTEAEKAEARLQALSFIETNYGYTEEIFVNEVVDAYRDYQLHLNVQDEIKKSISIQESDIIAKYNELVQRFKGYFESNPEEYMQMYNMMTNYPEYYYYLGGGDLFYIPAFKGVSHILLNVDQSLIDNWVDLSARLEENNSMLNSDPVNTNDENSTMDTTEDTTETKETVTEDMVASARQAILDSVSEVLNEISDKYASGATFESLIAQYGNDPGMLGGDAANDYQNGITDFKTLFSKYGEKMLGESAREGYAIREDSVGYEKNFTLAAAKLEKVGDISEPVVTEFGVHILYYAKDIPETGVEMTEELHEQIKEMIAEEAIDEIVYESAEIIYTNEGQAILDAAEAALAAEESVKTTEATEEVLEAEP